MPDITNDAFLRVLFDGDANVALTHLCAFPHDPDKDGGWGGGRGEWMLPYCKADLNTYYAVSLFTAATRRKVWFDRCYVLGIDDVGTKIDPARVRTLMDGYEPTYRLETSSGNEQWGYRINPPLRHCAKVELLQRAVRVKLTGIDAPDTGQEGVNRYFRLPVGTNRKAACGPNGFRVVLQTWNPDQVLDHAKIERLVDALFDISQAEELKAELWDKDKDNKPSSPGQLSRTTSTSTPTSTPTSTSTTSAAAGVDPVFRAMKRLGLVLGGPRSSPMGVGTYDVICPWAADHTARATTGTAYVPSTGAFKCQHGHCVDRDTDAVRARLEDMLRDATGGKEGLVHEDVLLEVVDPKDVPTPPQGLRGPNKSPQDNALAFMGRIVLVLTEGCFFDLLTRERYHSDREFNARFKHALYDVLPVLNQGTAKEKRLTPAQWYIEHPDRRLADGFVSMPGEGALYQDGPKILVNHWRPHVRALRHAPVGDVSADKIAPYLKLFWHILGDTTLEEWELGEHVLDLMALIAGSPTVKPGHHVVLTGQPGLGKELIIAPLLEVLGEQALVIKPGDLSAQFNPWMTRRLVLISEMRQTTRGQLTPHDQMALLKVATDNAKKAVWINPKYQAPYTARNVLALWITSNEQIPLHLDQGDRRFLVLNRLATPLWPMSRYADLVRWLRTDNNAARVGEYFHRRWVDMGDTRRDALMGHAPRNEDKVLLESLSADPIEAWLRETIATTPPNPMALPSVVSVAYVMKRLVDTRRNGDEGLHPNCNVPTATALGIMLRKLGGISAHDGKPVWINGRPTRLIVVRDYDLFIGLTPDVLAKIADDNSQGFSGLKS